MDNGYNNQQYTQQNNTQQYYNQPNYQPNNTQPNSQLNNQPGNNQSPKKSGKKSAIIVLCIILAVALGGAGIGVGSHFLSENSKGYEAVVASLEEGKYSEALQVYEDKYGYGNSDMELNDALVQRLLEIEDEFLEGEISYNKAIKEVETIGSMGIIAIEDDVAKTLLYVEQLEKKNNPEANKYLNKIYLKYVLEREQYFDVSKIKATGNIGYKDFYFCSSIIFVIMILR